MRYNLLFIAFFLSLWGVDAQVWTHTLSGVVQERRKSDSVPLEYVSVTLPDYGITTMTDKRGQFIFPNIASGKVRLHLHFVGMLPIDTLLNIRNDLFLNLEMQPENFRLKEVLVLSVSGGGSLSAGQSTSSRISRNAIDHLQATSLADVLSLLPGGLTRNQNLNSAKQINIRGMSSSMTNGGGGTTDRLGLGVGNMNSFGVSIISDGAPLSNNANLQTMNPAVAGATASLAGGASPAGGSDARLLSTDNIESVEVIQGIPSVRYGDISSGAVVIRSKAGRTPLHVTAKVNPNVYEASVSQGFGLGEKSGALNMSVDYAHNTNDIVQSYLTYQRGNARVMYSNRFFDKWTTNTSLNFFYGADRRKQNPDDQVTQAKSKGDNLGLSFNTNGIVLLQKPWLTNIMYVGSASYTSKQSYNSQAYSAANYVYSGTTTDGAVLSNKPGTELWDSNGNQITQFSASESSLYAREIPSAYVGRYDIDSKEVNLFARVMGNVYHKWGNFYNGFTFGVDYKSDGNEGDGKTFSPAAPPYRNLSALNASFRPRSYKDIPYVNQFGAFAEENVRLYLGDHLLWLTAGIRYDRISVVKDIFSPRANLSFYIVPKVLRIRGGYGIMAKAPSVLYLHPEKAYFEYVNLNELSTTSIPEDDRLLVTTTRVFNSENKNLKIARNQKTEVGFDLNIGQVRLAVTAFHERLKDGYTMALGVNSIRQVVYNEYTRSGDDLVLSASNSVLAQYYSPSNNLQSLTKGMEFDLNLGRFDAIRTSFGLNGMWVRNQSYSSDYTYFDGNSGTGGADRTHVAMYQKEMVKDNTQRFTTTLRATHNIPEIGFVVTLTAQAIWNESQWFNFGNDSIPVKYISKNDGQVYDFNPALKDDPEFKPLLRQVQESYYIKEKYAPSYTFNINVTKELGNYARVSFFANNMFRNYPSVRSKRTPSERLLRKQEFFFGLELSLTL